MSPYWLTIGFLLVICTTCAFKPPFVRTGLRSDVNYAFKNQILPLMSTKMDYGGESSFQLRRSALSAVNRRMEGRVADSMLEEFAERLKQPRWGGALGSVVRYLNISLVSLVFGFIMRVMNKFKAYRKETLLDLVKNRPKGRGLLTVANHLSLMDDPGLWSAVLPWGRVRPDKVGSI